MLNEYFSLLFKIDYKMYCFVWRKNHINKVMVKFYCGVHRRNGVRK